MRALLYYFFSEEVALISTVTSRAAKLQNQNMATPLQHEPTMGTQEWTKPAVNLTLSRESVSKGLVRLIDALVLSPQRSQRSRDQIS
jgi:hypothetical protein